jgi:hypothetical protein
MQTFFATVVVTLCCWFVSSSLWIYPHSLSYFNESIGGPLNGPRHLLGSNVDWGQDLRYAWDTIAHNSFQVVACLLETDHGFVPNANNVGQAGWPSSNELSCSRVCLVEINRIGFDRMLAERGILSNQAIQRLDAVVETNQMQRCAYSIIFFLSCPGEGKENDL